MAFIEALTTAGLEHRIDLDTLHLLRTGQIRLADLDDRPWCWLSDNCLQMRSMDTRQMMTAFAFGAYSAVPRPRPTRPGSSRCSGT